MITGWISNYSSHEEELRALPKMELGREFCSPGLTFREIQLASVMFTSNYNNFRYISRSKNLQVKL